ncbi:MAG: glyoxalase [Lachnospiraceae bacterium]|nr:glyoxalase [Lachnospiraceae bacterium]
MPEYDEAVLKCFLKDQSKLFPEGDVCSDLDEAQAFLEENFAVVVGSLREVIEYFEEEGIDLEDMDEESILEADEVFEVGDGRYLIIEG